MSAPIKKIFMGSLSVSIWIKDGKYGPFYSWSISRCYDGEEKYSSYFGEGDIYVIPRLADKVRDWLETHPLDDEKEQNE